VAFLAEDRSGQTTLVPLNQLTRMDPGVEESLDPMAGTFPDSRRLLRKLLDYDAQGTRFKVRSKASRRFIWVDEN
jgi:hypothetical protein